MWCYTTFILHIVDGVCQEEQYFLVEMAVVQKALTSLFRSVGQSLDKAGRCLELNPHIERRKLTFL